VRAIYVLAPTLPQLFAMPITQRATGLIGYVHTRATSEGVTVRLQRRQQYGTTRQQRVASTSYASSSLPVSGTGNYESARPLSMNNLIATRSNAATRQPSPIDGSSRPSAGTCQ
jgi:hypothetical protein